MTKLQLRSLKLTLAKFVKKNPTSAKYFHHGDCIGADDQAHDIAVDHGFMMVIHPPIDPKYRAWRDGEMRPEKDYIARNHDIVDESHLVIAATNSDKEVLRSGTWATIRYAKTQQKLWKHFKPKSV